MESDTLQGFSPNSALNTDDALSEEVSAPITRLCALDSLFAATGTVDVKITRAGKSSMLTLPIQSVDNELTEALAKKYRPKVPTRPEMKNNIIRTLIDEANQDYQDKLTEFNRIFSYIIVFLALNVDICDHTGKVVWSADNSMHDVEATRAAVKRMGLVDNQLVTILRAVRNLTSISEEVQTSD